MYEFPNKMSIFKADTQNIYSTSPYAQLNSDQKEQNMIWPTMAIYPIAIQRQLTHFPLILYKKRETTVQFQ